MKIKGTEEMYVTVFQEGDCKKDFIKIVMPKMVAEELLRSGQVTYECDFTINISGNLFAQHVKKFLIQLGDMVEDDLILGTYSRTESKPEPRSD